MNEMERPMTEEGGAPPGFEGLIEEPRAFSLVVSVGQEEFEHGRTRLHVEPNGSVRVDNVAFGDKREFETRLGEADVAELFRSVALGLPSKRHDRPGVPDEARYRFEISRGDRLVASMELWEGELEKEPQARSVLERLRELAASASERAVLL
jgi:hypothetical protein